MIGNENLNISRIESKIDKWLNKSVSRNVIFGDSLPSTINESWKEFVFVKCNNIQDYDALGQATILVYLYAKPLANNKKNGAAFIALEDKLSYLLKTKPFIENGSIRRRNAFESFDREIQWHYEVIELILTIF